MEARMNNNRILAYLLIGVGVLFLLARLEFGSSWLWLALVAAGFLAGYANQKSYGLLVIGCVLAGLAVGLLLGAGPLVMLGLAAGFLAIDRIEPRGNRWPIVTAAVLAGIGVLGWLIDTGFVGSLLFALILIAVGFYLLTRGSRAPRAQGGAAPFTEVAPQPTAPAAPDMPPAQPDVPTRAAPEPAEAGEAPGAEAVGEGPTPAPPLDEALLARLEAWRRETAAAEERAAYLVMTNDTLEQIARQRPRTLEELAAIRGIGPVKLERYGEALLALVAGAA